MPINTELLKPSGIDFSGFLDQLEKSSVIQGNAIKNRLAAMKAKEEIGAQEFFNRLAQGTPQTANSPEGMVGQEGMAVNLPGGMAGPPQEIDWRAIAQSPEAQANPEIAKRALEMGNLAATTSNAQVNAKRADIELAVKQQEMQQQQDLIDEVMASGRADKSQLLRLSRSSKADDQILVRQALDNPEASLASLKKAAASDTKNGSVESKIIQEMLQSGKVATWEEGRNLLTEEKAKIQKKAQYNAVKEYMGPDGMEAAASQFVMTGKVPGGGRGSVALYPVLQEASLPMLKELGLIDENGRVSPDLLAKQQDTQAIMAALGPLRKGESAINIFSKTIQDSIPRLKELAKKIPNKDWPLFARQAQNFLLKWATEENAPMVFNQFTVPLGAEYMRLMMMSVTGAVGQQGDSATRREIASYLGAGLPEKAMVRILKNIDVERTVRANAYTKGAEDLHKKLKTIWGKKADDLFKPLTVPTDAVTDAINKSMALSDEEMKKELGLE